VLVFIEPRVPRAGVREAQLAVLQLTLLKTEFGYFQKIREILLHEANWDSGSSADRNLERIGNERYY